MTDRSLRLISAEEYEPLLRRSKMSTESSLTLNNLRVHGSPPASDKRAKKRDSTNSPQKSVTKDMFLIRSIREKILLMAYILTKVF